MAALSFCSNLGYNYYPELPPLPEQATTQILPNYDDDHELLGYHEHFIFPENYLNPFLDLDELFCSESAYTNLLPYFSSSTTSDIVSLSSEIFPQEEADPYYGQCPKSQKTSLDKTINHLPEYFHPNDMFDGYTYTSSFGSNVGLPEPVVHEVPGAVVPKFEPPGAGFDAGRSDQSGKKQGGVSLSAQSIAARERRRKITEKTQELGRLIPGGNRMNTAEMFQAAATYVKFLQAQTQLLQLMGKMEVSPPQDLPNLLASPIVQEKLYMQEKCLVPKEVLEALASDQDFQSKTSMIQEIDQLLGFDHNSNHIYLP